MQAIAARGVKVQAQRISARAENSLREDLSSAACFEKFDARVNDFVIVDPPMSIVRTLLARRGRLRFPSLTGVVNVPMMRADGSILDAPGYDAATGLLFDPLGITFPPIPNRPTRNDAEKALVRLNDVIKDFPFVEQMHRSVALSAISTGCCCRSLQTAPLHACSRPGPRFRRRVNSSTSPALSQPAERRPLRLRARTTRSSETRAWFRHLLAGCRSLR